MMRILITSYSCCPNIGSEPGTGWNWIVNLARMGCVLFIISEGEFRNQVNVWMKEERNHDIAKRMHFYWIPVSEKVRKICWNQGDWRFYLYYAKWQKSALKMAQTIIDRENVDLMHHLNFTGFREPGMLYKINEKREKAGKAKIPLVWGPVTGFGSIPFSFMKGGGLTSLVFYLLKNILNKMQLRWHPRVRKMIAASDVVIVATPEMLNGLMKYYNKNVILLNETGTYGNPTNGANISNPLKTRKKFRLLWVGRFLYTKQLELALRTLSRLQKYSDIELHVVGKGIDDFTTSMMHYRAEEFGVSSHIIWHGQIPNDEVQQLMRECNVFFFTSIFEATSTVILEAITNNLPIVCFDRCGFGPIVDEKIGRKIPCNSPKQAVDDFTKEIIYLHDHPEELSRMSKNCEEKKGELSWCVKIDKLLEIYEGLIE